VDALSPKDRNAAIAAALILAVIAAGLMLMPRIMIGLGESVSPYVGVGVALLFILLPFVILGLRARAQRRAADKG
jgi:ABC-type sulfate transport system permease component